MATIYADELEVCTDCAMLIANGEGTREHAEAMRAVWGDDTIGLVLDGDGEDWFSSRQCDGCGSDLAGDRCSAAILRA